MTLDHRPLIGKDEIVTIRSSCPVVARPLDRFRNDLRRRYPEPIGGPPAPVETSHPTRGRGPEGPAPARLQQLPPEVGVLLVVVGTAGVLLPGPVGTPFLVAGGIALWPSGFRRVEDWLQRMAPGLFDTGVHQMEQFLKDLERRYPGSVESTGLPPAAESPGPADRRSRAR